MVRPQIFRAQHLRMTEQLAWQFPKRVELKNGREKFLHQSLCLRPGLVERRLWGMLQGTKGPSCGAIVGTRPLEHGSENQVAMTQSSPNLLQCPKNRPTALCTLLLTLGRVPVMVQGVAACGPFHLSHSGQSPGQAQLGKSSRKLTLRGQKLTKSQELQPYQAELAPLLALPRRAWPPSLRFQH